MSSNCAALVYYEFMLSVRFGTRARAVACILLLWVALDLGFPSLCALDQTSVPSSATANGDTRPADDSVPDPSKHVDDCFCCSHCVDVTSMAAPSPLVWAVGDLALPEDRAPFAAKNPLYHPPRG